MSYYRCAYHNCGKISQQVSMFRFPVNDENRLKLWIRNSGNILWMDGLTNAELSRRYICSDHFPPNNVHHGVQRSRLLGPAVPIPFQSDLNDDLNIESGLEEMTSLECPGALKVKIPQKVYTKRRIDRPMQIDTSSSSLSLDTTMESCPNCMLCKKPIEGFVYMCVQCDVRLCGACDERGAHAAHYVLRAPSGRPSKEISEMLAKVRKAISLNKPDSAPPSPPSPPPASESDEDEEDEESNEEVEIKTELKVEVGEDDPLGSTECDELYSSAVGDGSGSQVVPEPPPVKQEAPDPRPRSPPTDARSDLSRRASTDSDDSQPLAKRRHVARPSVTCTTVQQLQLEPLATFDSDSDPESPSAASSSKHFEEDYLITHLFELQEY